MAMSNAQKVLNAIYRERVDGEMCHTRSRLMKRANLTSREVDNALKVLHEAGWIGSAHGTISRSQHGRPTEYWFSNFELRWKSVPDFETGELVNGADVTSDPNPDVPKVIYLLTRPVSAPDYHIEGVTGSLADALTGFNPDKATELLESLDTKVEIRSAVARLVMQRVRWAFDTSKESVHGYKISREDLEELIDLEPLNDDRFRKLSKWTLNRLIRPWYTEYWSIGGLRLTGAKASRSYGVRRDESFKGTDLQLFDLGSMNAVIQDAIKESGSVQRAAYAIMSGFGDVVDTVTEEYDLPDGYDRSLMARTLKAVGSDVVNFDPHLFRHSSDLIRPVKATDEYVNIVTPVLPDLEGEDDRTDAQRAQELKECGASILWVFGNWNPETRAFTPLWLSDPTLFVSHLKRLSELGVRLDTVQHRLVSEA